MQKTTLSPSALPGQNYNFSPKAESIFVGTIYESDVKVRMIATADIKIRLVASAEVEY